MSRNSRELSVEPQVSIDDEFVEAKESFDVDSSAGIEGMTLNQDKPVQCAGDGSPAKSGFSSCRKSLNMADSVISGSRSSVDSTQSGVSDSKSKTTSGNQATMTSSNPGTKMVRNNSGEFSMRFSAKESRSSSESPIPVEESDSELLPLDDTTEEGLFPPDSDRRSSRQSDISESVLINILDTESFKTQPADKSFNKENDRFDKEGSTSSSTSDKPVPDPAVLANTQSPPQSPDLKPDYNSEGKLQGLQLLDRDSSTSRDILTTPRTSSNGHSGESSKNSGSESSNLTNCNNVKVVTKTSTDKKKKGSYWYNVLSPTYKTRSEDFRRIFKDIPHYERLIVDYSCALQKDILVHGRLYLTQNWICFYANIFRWETVLTLRCKDICSMTKEKTARVIPNAIQICCENEKYFFTSFGARDKTFLMLFRVWQFALMDKPLSNQELWQWVHYSYGDELGLTSDDDDYVAPSKDMLDEFQARIEEKLVEGSMDKEGDHETENSLTNGDISAVTPLSISSGGGIENISIATNSTDEQLDPISNSSSIAPPRLKVSSPSPDVTSADFPTDMGDTSEDEEYDVSCGHTEHPGFMALEEVFDMNITHMFNCIFSDCQWHQDFVKARKTYASKSNVVMPPWPDEPDADGNKTRTITYTLSLNYSIGPKSSPSAEKQTILSESKPGSLFVVETEVVNSGIPYGENFFVSNKYCISKVSNNKTRLLVHCEIKYKKHVWGLVKNFIEKNASAGLIENFNVMCEHLRIEAERLLHLPQIQAAGQPTGQSVKRKKIRRRRCHSNTNEKGITQKQSVDTSVTGPPHKVPSRKDENVLKLNAETIVRVLCAILILLVMFNALLFYKLYSLEMKADKLMSSQPRIIIDKDDPPKHTGDWLTLLKQQQDLHEQEIDRWKEILTSSMTLLDQMKSTLVELEGTIQKRTEFLEQWRSHFESNVKE